MIHEMTIETPVIKPLTQNRFEQAIIGESPQIKRVISEAKKIARSSLITTLIVGESGTGKELVARLIHHIGNYASQPFVDINCGAIPESLLESELFGYEKGAFTGAHTQKKGLFELADGGTIFLDEIGNTSLNFQVKLLKAVENKRFRRVGGVKEVQVSTRIIAATNIDLYEAVKVKKFREDLYYRLNVCQISVPPLRERADDALILANHFIRHFNREFERHIKGLTPEAEELIKTYSWPGNVRQLKNAIERAVLVEAEEWIEAHHLLRRSELSRSNAVAKTAMPLQITDNEIRFNLPPNGISLEEVERQLILAALQKSEGNLSKTARLLKISRGKLRYRLEKLRINPRVSETPL